MYVCMYVCIYCNPLTDCFVASRPTKYFKLIF